MNRAPRRVGRCLPAIFAGLAFWAWFGGANAVAADAPALPAAAANSSSSISTPIAAPAATDSPDSFDAHQIHRDSTDSTPIDSKPIPSDSHPLSFDSTRVILALGGILILILLLKAGLRKVLPGAAAARSTRAMQIISRCTISSRQQLLLIQVGKRLVVAGDSGTQLNPLCEITDSAEVEGLVAQIREEAAAAAGRFETFFGKARKEFAADSELAGPTSETISENPAENSSDTTDGAGASASEPAPAAVTLSGSAPQDSFDPSHELNDAEIDSSIAKTSEELSGLRQKVRDLSRQIGSA